jgi:hypothetical protein
MGSIFLLAIRLGFFGITWKEFKTEWKKISFKNVWKSTFKW